MYADQTIPSVFRKLSLWLRLLPRHPVEFYDRLATAAEVRLDARRQRTTVALETVPLGNVLADLQPKLPAGLSELSVEPAQTSIESLVRLRLRGLSHAGPFAGTHSADFTLARCCYIMCRALRPTVVVETGVAYGLTSAFILQALQMNNHGTLHSVDLPPLASNADSYVGALIPAELKTRHRLHRGVTRRVLPSLLSDLGSVNIFLHDSLHTYRNIVAELHVVTPCISRPAAVLVDDVRNNAAFADWIVQSRPTTWHLIDEPSKGEAFGLALFL